MYLLYMIGYGYHTEISCDENTDSLKNIVTKLQKRDFNNEVVIGKLIKKIPDYRTFFIPVIRSCPVNLKKHEKRDDALFGNVVTTSEELKYMLLETPFVSDLPFFNILTDYSVDKKYMILSITDSFRFILDSIQLLLDNGVIHFDIKGENIQYNTTSHNPQLMDFGISIPIRCVNGKSMKKYFYGYEPEYYVWALEVHAINFILHKTDGALCHDDIEEISVSYSNANRALDIFTPCFRQQYIRNCKKALCKYIGKPRSVVIDELLERSGTWDNYSLCIMYLKLIKYMFPYGFQRNQMIIDFSQLLLLNISPEYDKRLTIRETKRRFNDIFFVHDVDVYMELLDNLDFDKEIANKMIQLDLCPRISTQ